jgi:hypothetical protein
VKFFSTERQALLYPRKVANEADLIKLMAPVAFEIFLKWHEEFCSHAPELHKGRLLFTNDPRYQTGGSMSQQMIL